MADIDVQLEAISSLLPQLLRDDNTVLWNKLENSPVEQIGERNFLMPFQLTQGWVFGAVTSAGGDNMRGTGPTFGQMVGTFTEFGMATELTDRKIIIGGKTGSTTASGVKMSIAAQMSALPSEWNAAMEAMMYSNGKTFCFTATAFATVLSATEYTGDTVQGARLLRKGVPVSVYDSTGATLRANVFVQDIDYDARKVRLSAVVAGAAATDILTYGTFTGAQPAGLYGLKFWGDYSSVGTMLGVNRAAESEIRASGVAGGGAALSQDMVMQLYHKMSLRSKESVAGMVGYLSNAQRSTIINSTQAIQKIELTGSGGKDIIDRLPSYKSMSFEWAGGMMFEAAPLQSNNRIDFINAKNYRKAVLYEPKFFEDAEGKKVHRVYGTNGVPSFNQWVGYHGAFQVFNLIPRDTGIIDGLLVPAGYN